MRASARHILVPTELVCLTLKQQMQSVADFADLARNHSQCPSGRRGGDLGEFGPGQMAGNSIPWFSMLNCIRSMDRSRYNSAITRWKSRVARGDM